MTIGLRFDLPPKDAVAYLAAKGGHLAFDWQDTEAALHAVSFTVAKVTSIDVLAAIKQECDRVMAEGVTFENFAKTLMPRLQELGWWGRRELLDADTGEITEVQLGSMRRLRTIYNANMNSAYMAGRYKRFLDNADARPWWRYVAILDGRTRKTHKALDGKVWRYDDPIWNILWPPNGFNCRCDVQALTDEGLKRKGITPQATKPEDFTTTEVLLNRDGDTMPVTGVKVDLGDGKTIVFRPDAGWDTNQGKTALEGIQQWLEKKAATAPEALKPIYKDQAEAVGKSIPVEVLTKATDPGKVAAAGVKEGLQKVVETAPDAVKQIFLAQAVGEAVSREALEKAVAQVKVDLRVAVVSRFVEDTAAAGFHKGESVLVHVVSPFIISKMAGLGQSMKAEEILLTDERIWHSIREEKAGRGAMLPLSTWKKLPAHMEGAVVYFDTLEPALLYVFQTETTPGGKLEKVVVAVDYDQYTRPAGTKGKRVKRLANYVRTGGIIKAEDVEKNSRYLRLSE